MYQVKKHNINTLLNTNVTKEILEKENYDAIIIAIGAEPFIPKIEGLDGENVMLAVDAYFNLDKIGQKVAIYWWRDYWL